MLQREIFVLTMILISSAFRMSPEAEWKTPHTQAPEDKTGDIDGAFAPLELALCVVYMRSSYRSWVTRDASRGPDCELWNLWIFVYSLTPLLYVTMPCQYKSLITRLRLLSLWKDIAVQHHLSPDNCRSVTEIRTPSFCYHATCNTHLTCCISLR